MTGQLVGCDPMEGLIAIFAELSGADASGRVQPSQVDAWMVVSDTFYLVVGQRKLQALFLHPRSEYDSSPCFYNVTSVRLPSV